MGEPGRAAREVVVGKTGVELCFVDTNVTALRVSDGFDRLTVAISFS